jgi:hypothetical protein
LATLLVACLAAILLSLSYIDGDLSTWWAGLKKQLLHQDKGQAAFFLGQYSQEGWWYYFPVAFLVKTPLGLLALCAVSLALPRWGQRFAWRDVLCLLFPPALIMGLLTQAQINIGLRYALPVYPFLLVAAGRVATFDFRRAWLTYVLVGIPVVLAAASSLQVAPHQLAYFNELVGGPAHGYRYLSDSNLDWGQDLKGLKAYMEKEKLTMIYLSYFGSAPPEAYGIRSQYVPVPQVDLAGPPPPWDQVLSGTDREVLAISVTNLQEVYGDSDKDLYGWLREREPLAKIGYSIFLYDLTGDAEAHRQLANVYTKMDMPLMADHEFRKAADNRRGPGK